MLAEHTVQSFTCQTRLCRELAKPSPGISNISEMEQKDVLWPFLQGRVQICHDKFEIFEIFEEGLFIVSSGHDLDYVQRG